MIFGVSVSVTALAKSDIPDNFVPATAHFDYTKREVMIPMRDGVKLFTVIWAPKNIPAPMPMVITRTPYDAASRPSYSHRPNSPSIGAAVPLPDAPLVQNGYIRIYQDVRGKYGSEGEYILNLPPRGPLNSGPVDQSTDTWDTIDWLVKNVPQNNGRVGIIGVSYEGWTSLMALINPHPALKAAIPMNAMVDGWIGDDWYHNGAFRQFSLEYIYRQTTDKNGSEFPIGSRDEYSAYLKVGSANAMAKLHGADQLPAWKRIIDHPAYTKFWQDQAVDKLLKKEKLTVPTLTVHGLFDQEDIYGPIASYLAMEEQDKDNDQNFLIIGPWFHGQQDPWFHGKSGSQLGPLNWRSDTMRYFLYEAMLPFFDRFLKDGKQSIPPVRAFDTGSREWRTSESWGVDKVRSVKLHLQAGGKLSFSENGDQKGFDEYVSDPAKPVPYRTLPIIPISLADTTWGIWLVDDQRPFTSRPDVLTYVTEPLVNPVEVTGQITAHLKASTTGTDSDWVVKLIDVYPDEYPMQPDLGGYELMVSGDIMRGRYREDFSVAKPLKPGAALPYKIRMPHASHTFLPGHRIMVQVQSSWFPLYDRNPQNFVKNIAYAKPEDYRKAIQRVFHGSYIDLTVKGK